jgi:hypothetical protein
MFSEPHQKHPEGIGPSSDSRTCAAADPHRSPRIARTNAWFSRVVRTDPALLDSKKDGDLLIEGCSGLGAVWQECAFTRGGDVVEKGMTTLTIELPDEAARLAAEKASRVHLTLAEWVRLRIVGRRARAVVERDGFGYPMGWFERTCGSLAGVEDFREPEDSMVEPVPPIEL